MSTVKDFSEFALTEKELEEAKKKGLLPSDISLLRLKPIGGGEYAKRSLSDAELSSRGIKTYFIHESGDLVYDAFYLTDFFLICVLSNWTSKYHRHGTPTWTYTKPDDILVLPLKYVESCSVSLEHSYSGVVKGGTYEKDKSPIKGAAVGAVIAGPVGAVVGAVANSGTKTVTELDRHYNRSEYELVIKIGGKDWRHSRWLTINNLVSDDKRHAQLNAISNRNAEASQLIERAHTDVSEEEMTQIVNESKGAGKKKKQKENRDAVMGVICLIITLIIIVLCWLFITG